MTRTLNILLAEDNPTLAMLTEDALACVGHYVKLVSTNAGVYTALANSSSFDVVLLDLMLEGQFSHLVIEQLEKAGVKVPPVIIASGQDGDVVKRAAQQIGARATIVKPYTILQLDNALRALCASDQQNK